MRKTASHRVFGLSGYCTDPTEADKKMRKAIGWGVQLQKRIVRRIKLERLWRSGVLLFIQCPKRMKKIHLPVDGFFLATNIHCKMDGKNLATGR